ncbi:hypothetical protein PROH_03620 [Prochlorothrix hollandica PCC 9006 = CALU 1027]|uniref:Uncharacterized protein n=1 Tax=Prochlorothrix hollandica PCC 9006 = CALU 1027 TaxID=317619 RepID=A0A0M2PZ57_PROHO|nr:hypothetical protein PROH_03620 [Prochlorothrix hollandica PCC 9006 = CALU 1027]
MIDPDDRSGLEPEFPRVMEGHNSPKSPQPSLAFAIFQLFSPVPCQSRQRVLQLRHFWGFWGSPRSSGHRSLSSYPRDPLICSLNLLLLPPLPWFVIPSPSHPFTPTGPLPTGPLD